MRTSSTLLVLLRRASTPTLAGIHAVAVFALGARLGVIATALAVSRANARAAVAVGLATTACLGAERLVQVLTRTRLERDLHRAAVEALLETDVLDVARERSQRVVFEGTYQTVPLFNSVVPTLASDLVALLVAVPLVAMTFPERVIAIAALAIALVGGGVMVARRLASRGEQRLAKAYDELADAVTVAIDGRLEIVARGGERAFEDRFSVMSQRYVALADRVGLASAWLGRAPLALGAAAIGVVALVDASSRDELTTALFSQALVLAACFPPILGVALGAHAVARTTLLVRPFAQLLAAPRRDDGLAASGAPELPATFELDGVSFRYAPDQPMALSNVSLVWSAGEPLVLVGENGSGKSTLLKLLLALRAPSAGTIHVGGRPLAELDLRALRRGTVYLPQRPYLGAAHATVRVAVRIVAPGASDDAIEETLERVDLMAALRAHGGDPLAVTVGALSTGQRQRLALARVLLLRGGVVLLDEPDANLDREGVALVKALAEELSASGRMVAIAAHSSALASLSTNVVVLERAREA